MSFEREGRLCCSLGYKWEHKSKAPYVWKINYRDKRYYRGVPKQISVQNEKKISQGVVNQDTKSNH